MASPTGLQVFEVGAAKWAAQELSANSATYETDLQGVNIDVTQAGIKIVEAVGSKLPMGLGGLINAALNAAPGQIQQALANAEAQGIQRIIAVLNAYVAAYGG